MIIFVWDKAKYPKSCLCLVHKNDYYFIMHSSNIERVSDILAVLRFYEGEINKL